MQYFHRLFFASCLLILASCASAPGIIQYKQGSGQLSRVNLGDISVIAVEDAAGSMDISLFSGPLGDSQRNKYFKGGKAPSSVNVFLLNVENRLVLVDAGWGPDGKVRGQAMDELAKIGISPESIDFVILTHMHGDHISGLLKDGAAAFPNAQLLASRPEVDYWLDAKTLKGDYKGGAELSQKVAAAYAGRFSTFRFGEFVLPGVLAVEATGHTPGHTAYLVGQGEKRMLIAGDFLHAAALQFAQPEECPRYDMDSAKAIESRRMLIDMAIENNYVIAGMHIPFSGMGHVQKDGAGYRFTPLPMK